MSYFDAIVEIPFAPAGTTTDDIYQLLDEELNNGIYKITEESVYTRRGKHKRFLIEATCRRHCAFTREAMLNHCARVVRYVNYKNKMAKLRIWVRVKI
jgi:hypothetical protein